MAAAEITRAQTARRARLLRVRSYDVTLDFTRETAFSSVTTIRFDCAEPGAGSHADLLAWAVHEVTLNGMSLDPARVYDGAQITLPELAETNELTVRADCAFTHSGTGMHRSTDPADGRVYVYGKFTPAHARTAFACFEQPDLKAPFTFHVTAPAGWTVLSNTEEHHLAERPGESATHHFQPTPPLPTFATTVIAGGYHVERSAHVTPDGREIPLMVACRASMAEHLGADALFALTGQGIDFYEELLGHEYPYPKYGHAFVPEFSAGATEKPGCVLMSENFLFRGRATAAQEELRTMVVLHEMAHMWFGNLVTFRWWDDLWLSESFAEFCGHDASVRLGLYPGSWSTFSLTRKAWGFAQDRLPTTHPVAAASPDDVATLSQAVANFDGISYAKGAAVLRQLAAYAGEENFFAGIRDYLTAHAFGNAELPDLLSAVAAHTDARGAGKDLAAWGRAWLQTAGPNILRAEFQTAPDGTFTSFEVVQDAVPQETGAGHPVLRPHHVSIGLYQAGEGGITVGRSAAIEAAGARTGVPGLASAPRTDLILLNDDDLGYALVRFDPRSLRTVLASLGEIADPVARAVCWNALADMVAQAELPVPAFTRALVAGLRGLPPARASAPVSASELQAVLTLAQPVVERLAAPPAAADAKKELAALAAEMLDGAEPGGDPQLLWAQLLSWTATTPPQLDLVAEIAAGTASLPGLEAGAELRWALLRRLCACGRAGEAEINAELALDPTDAGHRNATACRAAIPSAVHKKAAWTLLSGGGLGPASVRLTARAFMLPEHSALLADYADEYVPALAEIWDERGGHLKALLGELLFPYPVVSAQLLSSLASFAASRPGDLALGRLAAELGDFGARALRSRAL